MAKHESHDVVISFENKNYNVNGDSALLIDREQLETKKREHRTLKGFTFDAGT